MKNNPESLVKQNLINSIFLAVSKFIMLVIFGFCLGYMLNKAAVKDGNTDNNFFIISVVGCLVIAFIILIIRLILILRRYYSHKK